MRMEDSPALGKRKAEEKVDDKSNTSQGDDVPGDAVQADQKRRNVARTCIHEVAIPPGYVSTVDETVHGSISDPSYKGPMAKTYPFVLDPFQQVSVACLERNESVLVSAHTSAGKTAVAEYAIAMAFRDKQRVIYTSPLKALSNQKYRELSQEFSDVGLMTGDVSLSPNASCLVMTTEILRGMLYRGSELLKEVAWVIFDEIHYMKDRERGVVWEESIIFLPPAIKMVFLSATMSNATEFAEWICKLHSQPCHVVYTDFRPTPLQHYAFPIGGSGLYLVVDEKEQFREDNFMKLQEVFPKKIMDDGLAAAKNGLGLHGNAKGGPKGGKSTKTPGGDIYRIVKVAETRFASHTIVLRRLVRVKEALCQMVISNKWGGWKQVDTEKAKIVKDLIFNDDFWNRVEYALELTEPLMSMLRYADTDEPCLGNIYDAMDSMLERMKSVIQRREQDPDTLYSTVEKIVLHRWNKMTTPLHLLAYALSPRYYSSEILDIPGRVPPYRDPEVAAGYKRALSKLFSDPDVASNVRREFVDFVSGKFAEPDAINDQSRLDAIGWWYLHGERYMYLQPLAIKILSQMIMERKFQPVIIFSFSRRECEQHALSIMSKLDFNSEEEKQDVEQVFKNAILCLHEEDRNLPAVELMLPLLKRGIAVHHSGLLPIIKELVELLFQEGLVKALFATETFAMGLNMPAKTVVFTQLRKFDGDNHRYMTSGEYIQMSGRAGRRGKDERGISILIVDEQMEMKTCKDMILGKPAPLVSTFRLSYYTLLNLMSRAEGQFDQEYVIKNSFHQFQHEKALPEVEARVSKLEQEAAILDASEEAALAEYHKLRLHISHLEKQMMQEISRPERVLLFLVPGRLVKVRDGVTEWGWGVIVNTVKKPPVSGTLPSTILTNRTSSYIVDTLLHCTSTMTSDGPRPKPRPAISGQKGEMHVVPVQLSLICSLSTLRVAIPQDLRPPEARQSVLMAVQELEKRFPKGLPKLDPIEDMGINDPDFVKIVKEVEETEQKLLCHPMHKAEQDENQYKSFQRKAELNNEAHQLRMKMRESQLHKFREELRNRSRVLKRLGHIDADGVVQLKGRAACYIDTGDELLATELMFNGVFNELDHHQVASLASCFVPCEKSNDAIHLSKEIQKPLQQLQDSARWIAQVQRECKLDVNPEEYVEATSRPFLMDIIYHWSKGASFAEVTSKTDLFEGSIIRTTRRLEEFLNQLKAAARAIGDAALEKKFEDASESIRHGIIFANSLYL